MSTSGPSVGSKTKQRTSQMIVIGADPHKRHHTCVGANSATGQLAGELTAPARKPGFRARARAQGPGRGQDTAAGRPARLRGAHRRQDPRRDRRRRALRIRRQARPPCRRRSDPRLLGKPTAPSPRPRWQPPAQLRPAPGRGHPGSSPPTCPGLLGPKAGRRQVANRGASLPQAPPCPSGLAGSSSLARRRVLDLPLSID